MNVKEKLKTIIESEEVIEQLLKEINEVYEYTYKPYKNGFIKFDEYIFDKHKIEEIMTNETRIKLLLTSETEGIKYQSNRNFLEDWIETLANRLKGFNDCSYAEEFFDLVNTLNTIVIELRFSLKIIE